MISMQRAPPAGGDAGSHRTPARQVERRAGLDAAAALRRRAEAAAAANSTASAATTDTPHQRNHNKLSDRDQNKREDPRTAA